MNNKSSTNRAAASSGSANDNNSSDRKPDKNRGKNPAKDGKKKSNKKTMWVDVQKCFHCGKHGHNLPKCKTCSQAFYCNVECQRKHWKKHRPICRSTVAALARDATRQRAARAVRKGGGRKKAKKGEDDALCVICLSPPTDPVELPCGHEYCGSCLAQLREKGVDKSCPLCREKLPPGPEMLYDLGERMYMKIKNMIDQRRPGVDSRTPWPALSAEQQREMDEARGMLREAADQGHMMAQAHVGDMYMFGNGVAKDDRLAFEYDKKAAQQGNVTCMFNTGFYYRDGTGCEQSYERAAEWFEKAVRKGRSGAMLGLGELYREGQGVPQSFEKAAELYKQSAAQGNAVSQRDQTTSHLQMLKQTSLVFTHNPPLHISH